METTGSKLLDVKDYQTWLSRCSNMTEGEAFTAWWQQFNASLDLGETDVHQIEMRRLFASAAFAAGCTYEYKKVKP
jgi:hypothetical protein